MEGDHVMARGLERRAIFRDDRDRHDFVQRLAPLTQARDLGGTPMAIWRGPPRWRGALLARGLGPRRLARAAMK